MQTKKTHEILHREERASLSDVAEQKLQAEVKAASMVEVVPRILDVVCKITGMRFAAMARVTDARWIACNVQDSVNFGMVAGDELNIAETFCTTVHKSDEPVLIDDVPNDIVYCQHPIPAQYGFKSYISVPIKLPNGEFFGTLCALDPTPSKVKGSKILSMFELFTELIGLHVYAAIKLEKTEESLLQEKQTAALREQFIAVLGHDLKNPLGAIQGSASLLSKMELTDRALPLVNVVTNSCQRMGALIDDITDFARGRLGGGIIVKCRPESGLESAINATIEEIKVKESLHNIKINHRISTNVCCDQQRLLQVVSNLLANAVAYGDTDQAITIETETTTNQFILKVNNAGQKIPEDRMPYLFNPFCRDDESRNGLGLGLYISSEIAKAHKGTLNATSSDEETCFCLSIPLKN